jgi:hypothetical protein
VVRSFLAVARLVEGDVERHDGEGRAADEQAPGERDALGLEHAHLGEQFFQVDDHPVAQDAGFAGVEDAGGDEVEDELLPVDHHGVPALARLETGRSSRRPRQ